MTRAGQPRPRQNAPAEQEPSRRSVVDYALRRRLTLTGLAAGTVAREDACDAHPELLNAARFHGEPAGRRCPVCRRQDLTLTRWLYGAELGASSGCSAYPGEVAHVAAAFAEVRVWVVEVCDGCSWNHLTESYVVGHGGVPAKPRRRSRQ
jgi:hypothetical protein